MKKTKHHPNRIKRTVPEPPKPPGHRLSHPIGPGIAPPSHYCCDPVRPPTLKTEHDCEGKKNANKASGRPKSRTRADLFGNLENKQPIHPKKPSRHPAPEKQHLATPRNPLREFPRWFVAHPAGRRHEHHRSPPQGCHQYGGSPQGKNVRLYAIQNLYFMIDGLCTSGLCIRFSVLFLFGFRIRTQLDLIWSFLGLFLLLCVCSDLWWLTNESDWFPLARCHCWSRF